MLFVGVFYPLAGTLVGAADTRTPFYARFAGVTAFLLGGSYFLGIHLGFGLVGVYVGIVSSYVCRAIVVVAGFYWGSWQAVAERLIAERAEA